MNPYELDRTDGDYEDEEPERLQRKTPNKPFRPLVHDDEDFLSSADEERLLPVMEGGYGQADYRHAVTAELEGIEQNRRTPSQPQASPAPQFQRMEAPPAPLNYGEPMQSAGPQQTRLPLYEGPIAPDKQAGERSLEIQRIAMERARAQGATGGEQNAAAWRAAGMVEVSPGRWVNRSWITSPSGNARFDLSDADPEIQWRVKNEEHAITALAQDKTLSDVQRDGIIRNRQKNIDALDPDGLYRRGGLLNRMTEAQRWAAARTFRTPNGSLIGIDAKGTPHTLEKPDTSDQPALLTPNEHMKAYLDQFKDIPPESAEEALHRIELGQQAYQRYVGQKPGGPALPGALGPQAPPSMGVPRPLTTQKGRQMTLREKADWRKRLHDTYRLLFPPNALYEGAEPSEQEKIRRVIAHIRLEDSSLEAMLNPKPGGIAVPAGPSAATHVAEADARIQAAELTGIADPAKVAATGARPKNHLGSRRP